ncbi:MAG TPA: hypothetical protein VFV05_03315 [Methylomirabilota bacterium]|nr:hypothetical protein [Methylomirabilota bacterium]
MESWVLLKLLWIAGVVVMGAVAVALGLFVQWLRERGVAPGTPGARDVAAAGRALGRARAN